MKSACAVALGVILYAGAADAGEAWSCAWATPTGEGEGRFEVKGASLTETDRDVILDYQLLEDSKDAIVAAKGGAYASEPRVMAFVVMIRKTTGDFAFTTTSIGGQSERQTGKCSRENSN